MPAAFAGALAAVGAVYLIAQTGGRPSAVNLLLAGAAMSTLLSAGVTLLMYLSDRDLHEVFAWLMGGLGGRSWPQLASAAPLIVLGVAVLWALSRPLDALTGGDDAAQSLGLNLSRADRDRGCGDHRDGCGGGGRRHHRVRRPHHPARMPAGHGGAHANLIPVAALAGGLLVLLADDLARTIAAPVELPVGVLMALIGAPFFLWLLKRG